MITCHKVIPQGQGLAKALVKRAPTVALTWQERRHNRIEVIDSTGEQYALALPRGQVLRGGDVLIAEDGSLIQVLAATQPVQVVTACQAHGSPIDLTRAAYCLGARQVPLEITPDRLLMPVDAVLAELLRGMHLIVTEARSTFEPESGAHGLPPGHEHAHEAYDHDHGDIAPAPLAAADAED